MGMRFSQKSLLLFQVMEKKTKGDEDENDEDREDRLEDEREDAGETHETLAALLHALDDPLGCSFEGSGAEEGKGGNRRKSAARCREYSCSTQSCSRSRAGRKFDESRER